MQIWFWAAVGGAIFAGISNFYFKQVARKGYSAELFSLYGALISCFLISAAIVIRPVSLYSSGIFEGLSFAGGLLASTTNIFKVYALRHIDSTIYFPLYKLLAPSLAILAGVCLFQESFSKGEWIGMGIGLLVPLLLITKAENGRQNNLIAGLVLVVITGVTSALTSVTNKFAVDASIPTLTILLYVSLGVFVGTIFIIGYKDGFKRIIQNVFLDTTLGLFIAGGMRAALITVGFGLTIYALELGGTLAVVQTIQSMYILIPIVLSIILYNEHWNFQKAAAVVLSVASLALLG